MLGDLDISCARMQRGNQGEAGGVGEPGDGGGGVGCVCPREGIGVQKPQKSHPPQPRNHELGEEQDGAERSEGAPQQTPHALGHAEQLDDQVEKERVGRHAERALPEGCRRVDAQDQRQSRCVPGQEPQDECPVHPRRDAAGGGSLRGPGHR